MTGRGRWTDVLRAGAVALVAMVMATASAAGQQTPPAGTPPAANPPAGNPPAANPPGGSPPAGNAPAANPPAANPPAGNPPAANPPAANDVPPAPAVPAVRLYMPDGQLQSHRLQVYLTGVVTASQSPRLQLFRSHAITDRVATEEAPMAPVFVAAGEWVEPVNGVDQRQYGTILLFDASKIPIGYKAMVRVRPALRWVDNGVEKIVIGSNDVNVGNVLAASAWSILIVVAALALIIVLARRAKKISAMMLLTGIDGHLALSQTQVACWTVAVGGVVLGYGLIRLQIPRIPESLLVLMGASLVTGGLAFIQDAKKDAAVTAAKGTRDKRTWQFSDLVHNFTDGQPDPEPSLAKAQMLFWTILLLVLFVSKTVLEGAIWEIPWPLVALMGFSQAGYLAPKIASQPAAQPQPQQQPAQQQAAQQQAQQPPAPQPPAPQQLPQQQPGNGQTAGV